ncbi:flagellar biosynthetic protein FlhB [Paucimonas lemoignei]|uniref:Flagellar biosynthetic protein FlhB n=1 Tax=Paucimonas lemoignei TaxID=29443 RepID=A0A4V2UIW2_PAULE|nr:flagellar biosynthesis protein FlhB [Paucimonas lemoignei]TCS37710.1 flagellar biosynthetic protein FlhB [Paucimonas lemoignei]
MAEEQEKSEQASEFKLKEAKKRGSVAKSMDINSFAVLLMLVVALSFWGKSMLAAQLRLSQYILSNAGMINFAPKQFTQWVVQLFFHALLICLPLFLLILVAGILANLFQTGPIFSTFPLKPDWKRINPAEGFKRLFSMKIVVETIKSVLKIAALGATIYLFIHSILPVLFGLGQSEFRRYPVAVLDEATSLIKWCLLALLPLAMIDLIYTRRDFFKKMMMSRREVKDEYKQREGDPRIRSKIRELQREARKRSKSLRNVKEADVLITNPTRLAIALRYDREHMAAPMIVAKGAGQLAKLMREMAFRHQVPVVENKRLARALFRQTAIDTQIPEVFYPAAAKLLMWVYAKRNAQNTARKGAA